MAIPRPGMCYVLGLVAPSRWIPHESPSVPYGGILTGASCSPPRPSPYRDRGYAIISATGYVLKESMAGYGMTRDEHLKRNCAGVEGQVRGLQQMVSEDKIFPVTTTPLDGPLRILSLDVEVHDLRKARCRCHAQPELQTHCQMLVDTGGAAGRLSEEGRVRSRRHRWHPRPRRVP